MLETKKKKQGRPSKKMVDISSMKDANPQCIVPSSGIKKIPKVSSLQTKYILYLTIDPDAIIKVIERTSDISDDEYVLAFDSSGNLFIADTGNHRIRVVRGPFN